MADADGQAKIWLIVPPTIGLPFLLLTVALIAVLVHVGFAANSTWYKNYLNGTYKRVAITQPASIPAPAAIAPQVR